jgi:hypothetical protein
MEPFTEVFSFMAGTPAVAGLILTGLTIYLTSDWRLSLTALLVQYILVGLALTRAVQAEVAVVKILVGVLTVFILYLTARRVHEMREPQQAKREASRFLRLNVGWAAGPLGLPLRLLALLLVALALIRLFNDPRLSLSALATLFGADGPGVSADIAFAALWLAGMGLVGLALSGDPLRVAPAVLTFLAGFDLVFAGLEPSLAVVGFFGALILLAALAFSYLATVQALGAHPAGPDEEEAKL